MSLILDGTNGLSDVDGSAGTPAIRGSDANTGIFFPAADTIAFAEGGVESMRLNSSGNVGIGTSSPVSRLHVVGPQDQILAGNGTVVSFLGGSGTDGYTGTFTNHPFTFYTNSSERMRIDSSGNLLVGTTSAQGKIVSSQNTTGGTWAQRHLGLTGGADPGIGFQSSASNTACVFKFWGGSTQFECRNGSDNGFIPILASAFTVSSDYRIKTDVVEAGTVLPNVLALRPVNYEKDGVHGREYGLIAHEAQEHFPELVQGEKDGMRSDGSMELQTVNYMGLTSVLVKAIQELKAINDAQAQTIESLTARVVALEGQA